MQQENYSEVLSLAARAGRILLENGAEISRVDDIMSRISSHYGVDSGQFFVLSNGIFTSGNSSSVEKVDKAGGQAQTYANVEFVPIKTFQFAKVIAVNKLSYDISRNKYTVREAWEELDRIQNLPGKPLWERIAASSVGACAFCAIFGGGFTDCLVSFAVGFIFAFFSIFVSSRYFSKIVATLAEGLVLSMLCIVAYRLGLVRSLSNVIIGSVMLLVPGLAFVNGVRDLANADYLSGLTRMTDALLTFLCIAIGVSFSFIVDSWFMGEVISLPGVVVSMQTYGYPLQALAAFLSTMSFAAIFGVPRANYLMCGLTGTIGWLVYLLMLRTVGASIPVATVMATVTLSIVSRFGAVKSKCPATVFMLCGLFPLVPGGGIFWCIYYCTTSQLQSALSTGFVAAQVVICIVLGIVLAMELPQRIFSGRKKLIH